MNKNIKLKIKKSLKSIGSQIWANKFMLAYMATVIIMQDTSCFASSTNNSVSAETATVSSELPWSTGLNKFKTEMTGPMAKTFSAIAIAGAGAAYVFGTSQLTQIGSKVALGTGIACGAPSLVNYATGVGSSGCVF